MLIHQRSPTFNYIECICRKLMSLHVMVNKKINKKNGRSFTHPFLLIIKNLIVSNAKVKCPV